MAPQVVLRVHALATQGASVREPAAVYASHVTSQQPFRAKDLLALRALHQPTASP